MPYALFLRAANVGGNNVFRPKDFCAAHPALQLTNFGAAGTFVSSFAGDAEELRAAVLAALPVQVDLAVVEQAKVQTLIEAGGGTPPPGSKCEVTVLLAAPNGQLASLLDSTLGDASLRVVANHGFAIVTHRVLGGKAYPFEVIGRALGIPCTTRSWAIMEKVARAG